MDSLCDGCDVSFWFLHEFICFVELVNNSPIPTEIKSVDEHLRLRRFFFLFVLFLSIKSFISICSFLRYCYCLLCKQALRHNDRVSSECSEHVNSQSWQWKWTDEETGQYQCYSVRMRDEFLQHALYMMVKEVTTATYISLESKLIRSQKHSFMYNDTCNCRYSHAWL